MKKIAFGLGIFLYVCSSLASGQVANPTPIPGRTSGIPAGAPSSMAHIGPEMSLMLSQLERTAQQTTTDVGRLSIKKWKTDSGFKEQALHDANSVQVNVTSTLPTLISQVRAAPDNTATLFKLYRNVDALLEVVRGLAESAGAFGPKSEYEPLQTDSQNLSSIRGSLASQVDTIATAKESELNRMKAQLAQAQAATTTSTSPKKVIVDDNEPAHKKVIKKKKPTAKASAGTQSDQTQSNPPPKQ
jgi:hypothetical protein